MSIIIVSITRVIYIILTSQEVFIMYIFVYNTILYIYAHTPHTHTHIYIYTIILIYQKGLYTYTIYTHHSLNSTYII